MAVPWGARGLRVWSLTPLRSIHSYGSTYTPAAAEIGDKYQVLRHVLWQRPNASLFTIHQRDWQVPVISGGSAAESVFTNITTGRRRFEYLVGLNSPAEEYFADFVDLMALQGAKTLVVLAEDAAFPSVRDPIKVCLVVARSG